MVNNKDIKEEQVFLETGSSQDDLIQKESIKEAVVVPEKKGNKYIFIFGVSILLIIVSLIGYYIFYKDKTSETLVNLDYYKNVWKNTFLNYQKTQFKIPKKGNFEFGVTMRFDDKNDYLKLSKLGLKDVADGLNVNVQGNYDFTNENDRELKINFKNFLNDKEFGSMNIDFSLYFEKGGKIFCSLNEIEGDTMKFFGFSKKEIEDYILVLNDIKREKSQLDVNGKNANLLSNIVETFNDAIVNPPLEKNTKEQESQIIEAFLVSNVIDIISGKKVDNGDELYFKFNSDNFVNFLNKTAKIIGENVDFSQDKEKFKNINISGNLLIKNNLIMDSAINTKMSIVSNNPETKGKPEIINVISEVKLPDAEGIDFDIKTQFFSDSKKDNKVLFGINGFIK